MLNEDVVAVPFVVAGGDGDGVVRESALSNDDAEPTPGVDATVEGTLPAAGDGELPSLEVGAPSGDEDAAPSRAEEIVLAASARWTVAIAGVGSDTSATALDTASHAITTAAIVATHHVVTSSGRRTIPRRYGVTAPVRVKAGLNPRHQVRRRTDRQVTQPWSFSYSPMSTSTGS